MAGKQIPEMNYLMSLVERKYRKAVKTSTDFYTLAADIESKTKERVSPSTLKRMWGYVNMTPYSQTDNPRCPGKIHRKG